MHLLIYCFLCKIWFLLVIENDLFWISLVYSCLDNLQYLLNAVFLYFMNVYYVSMRYRFLLSSRLFFKPFIYIEVFFHLVLFLAFPKCKFLCKCFLSWLILVVLILSSAVQLHMYWHMVRYRRQRLVPVVSCNCVSCIMPNFSHSSLTLFLLWNIYTYGKVHKIYMCYLVNTQKRNTGITQVKK